MEIYSKKPILQYSGQVLKIKELSIHGAAQLTLDLDYLRKAKGHFLRP